MFKIYKQTVKNVTQIVITDNNVTVNLMFMEEAGY